jgi:hypothetical protein
MTPVRAKGSGPRDTFSLSEVRLFASRVADQFPGLRPKA